MLRSVFAGLVLVATLTVPACTNGAGPIAIIPVDPPPAPSPPGQLPPPPQPQVPPNPPPIDDLAGGVVATFKTEGIGPDQKPFTEAFSVWVTNPQTINDLFDMQAGIGANRHVNGRILEGPGQGEHNAPYSWHLDPDDVHLADLSIEVCDGRPSFVEDNLDAYLAIERYCPWGARLDSIQDFR